MGYKSQNALNYRETFNLVPTQFPSKYVFPIKCNNFHRSYIYSFLNFFTFIKVWEVSIFTDLGFELKQYEMV